MPQMRGVMTSPSSAARPTMICSKPRYITPEHLYISKNEQRDRLLAREADHSKSWKLSTSDWPEHELYDDYVGAYEKALSKCSTKAAPWFVIPSDKKWYRNYAVAQIVVDAMRTHRDDWQQELDERGKQQLAAIAALKQSNEKQAAR